MLFQLTIKEQSNILILRDVVSLDNVTHLVEVATGIMEYLELDMNLNEGFEMKIDSERGTHINFWFPGIQEVSNFKNAFYQYLIKTT